MVLGRARSTFELPDSQQADAEDSEAEAANREVVAKSEADAEESEAGLQTNGKSLIPNGGCV